ncbi:hypothetical protein EDC96DRAFT_72375 [Choanephora cucurbitarum]|nr:hypothetical protein EDC96DRAFT_72375 [Choanephora cucurbitarum]
MHEIISLSKESDAMLMNLLKTFHAHSYKEEQQLFGTLLSSHFEMYIETVMQLQPLIDTYNLSRLRDMYSASKEIPSVLLEFESHQFGLEDIDLIHSVIIWKRREYLLHLLALDVMSNNKTTRYGQNWRQAIHINKTLVESYNEFNKKLFDISVTIDNLQSTQTQRPVSISSIDTVSDDLTTEGAPDEKALTLMHRVSALEKYIEDIQAKLFLCKQDARLLTSHRVSVFSLERMNKRFGSIEETMNHLNNQWEESKMSLNALLSHEEIKLKSSLSSLPSPPISPTSNEHTDTQPDRLPKNTLNRSQSLNSFNRKHSFNQNRLSRIQSLKLKNNHHRKSFVLPSQLLTNAPLTDESTF